MSINTACRKEIEKKELQQSTANHPSKADPFQDAFLGLLTLQNSEGTGSRAAAKSQGETINNSEISRGQIKTESQK